MIEANLPLKICSRVNSAVDSGIVPGESGGQNLVGHGDLLCDRGLGAAKLRAAEIEVVYDAIEKDNYGHLMPPEIFFELNNTLFLLVRKNPKKAIGRLEELKRQYPDHPRVYNLLMNAYSMVGKDKEAAEIAEENYRRAPRYLFAKANYAQICMQKGDMEKVPEIFENTFDLKSLYPDRKQFHVTELVAFYGVAGIYFARTGKTEQANLILDMLKTVAPTSAAVKYLRDEIANAG